MAVKFIRMTDRGGVTNPTMAAMGLWGLTAATAMFFLRNHPYICIFLAWPFLYVVSAVLMSQPLRVTIAWLLWETRERLVTSVPTSEDRLWMEYSRPVFEKTGIRLYRGEKIDTLGNLDVIEKTKK